MEYCILKKNGKIFRTKKAPFETNEQAMDRLWYISSHSGITYAESLKWAYKKYIGVKY